ncbi:MAG: AmmeMemoRadiSam system protein A [Anaerolineaceae bacterium]|nr:AmmeMemoRadiSam system protein A [Anaerolineaceae bacterium]
MNNLSLEERKILLILARDAIELAANGAPPPHLVLTEYPPRLREPGASFVTLTVDGNLRGCIGTLDAHQPLVQDVYEHARAAAMQDYRFLPVKPDELDELFIEISCLSNPEPLIYRDPGELIANLRPGVDGVVIRDGLRRATFLPQVWDKIPDPETFLAHLCLKLGGPEDLWKRTKLDVLLYQVEEFHE